MASSEVVPAKGDDFLGIGADLSRVKAMFAIFLGAL